MKRFASLLPPLALVFGAACSPIASEEEAVALLSAEDAVVDEGPALIQAALETARDDCLLMVWSEQGADDATRNVEFDRANDQVEGGAISCATGTSASQFEAALVAIREAAKSGNEARMLEEIGIPLVYIDAEGERQPLEDKATIAAMFDDVFDPSMLAMLEKLSLKDMTVVPEQGAFFELGSVWLVVDEAGGRPRIITVNHQAVGDAAKAAIDAAERGDGKPVPDA